MPPCDLDATLPPVPPEIVSILVLVDAALRPSSLNGLSCGCSVTVSILVLVDAALRHYLMI